MLSDRFEPVSARAVWLSLFSTKLTPLGESQGSLLFHWLPSVDPAALHDFFAQRGILTRRITDNTNNPGIRIGLPGNESEWQRLASAVAEWTKEKP